MKNRYLQISSCFILFFLLGFTHNALGQKNLKLRIISVRYQQTSGTDCDDGACFAGNGKNDIAFDIDDGSDDVDETCHEGDNNTTDYTWNANFNPYDRNFDYACQWPSGNLNFIVEAWDRDVVPVVCPYDQCIGGGLANTTSDKICDVNITAAYPSSVSGIGVNQTLTCSATKNFDGGGNCGTTVTVVYRWEQTGNWRPQTSDDYICGAYNLGTLNSGATLSRNDFNNYGYSEEDICSSNEPNISDGDETIWLKFKTGPSPGTNINVDASGIGGSGSGGACIAGGTLFAWCKVYEGPDNLTGCPFTYSSNQFSQLSQVGNTGLDLSDIDIQCPKANQTYYIQVESCTPGVEFGCAALCDEGRFNLSVNDNGVKAGPDYICLPAGSSTVGIDGYMGTLNSSFDPRTTTGSATAWDNSDYDLAIFNQSTDCASQSKGCCNEPDNTTILSSLSKTVWYRFRTPAPDYPSAPALAQLAHTYKVLVERLGSSGTLTYPAVYVYEETNSGTVRVCPNSNGDYANLSFMDRDEIDPLNIFNGGNAEVRRLCLKANTNYFIQIDPVGISDRVDFNVKVVKDQFRPSDMICDAVDLGYITTNGLQTGVTTGVNWANNGPASKLGAAKFFGLPHTNKCTSAENGEPQASPGGPGTSGTHTATVWYKFTTGSNIPPDWIYWYENDNELSNANRGSVCIGLGFQSRVTFYKNITSYPCPVGGNLMAQDEMNIPGDLCDASTGIGFGAPCYADMFRLKCPEPNTTYYVQVEDFNALSICYEGQWSFDNGSYKITTASSLGGAPINDTICGAIDIGTVPNGGQLAPAAIYDNFCATPDLPWRADFTQSLDKDVWFRFNPPLSGSVRITAQSAPTGSPGIDDDLDMQVAIWEPILGDGTNAHCSDPRFLWTPIIAQDHGIQEATEESASSAFGPYYNIYNTCGNSVLCNEGNSLIATCLDPNKYYYIQVDGGDYFGCDLFDAGDCISGYFKLQVADAGLGLYNSANPPDVGTPFTTLGVPNATLRHDEPCFAQSLPVNASATAYGSLSWTNMTNRCATSINDPVPSEWSAQNASTDKTVWARFVAPASGKVKIRAENRSQLKGDEDYHDDINLQLALYQTANCFDKWRLTEVGNGNGFDGGLTETDFLNDDDYTGVCVPCVGICGYDEYYVGRCLIPGQTYYIMIDGDAGYTCGADVEDVEGDFRISVQALNGIPASTNDSICMAYNMTPISNVVGAVYNSPIAFNNECAGIDPSYEGSGKVAHTIAGTLFDFNVEHTLWFKFVAPSTGKVTIEAVEDGGTDDIDLGIAIFDIPSQNCADIQTGGFKFDDDYDPAVFGIASSDDEEITVSCLVPGRTYWVQVDGNRNLTTCGPAFSGTDCETGQFRMKITTLAADQTYASTVTYSSPATTSPGGNDMFCQAHQVVNAGGTYNSGNQNTYLHPGETINFHHNNRCATSERNEPEANGWDLNPFDSGTDPTVWYTFNTGPSLGPLRPGDITIRVTNPSGFCLDPDLDLYEYNGTFTAAACNLQAASNTQFSQILRIGEGKVFNILQPREEEIKITCPKPNTRYFLRVLGTSACPLFGDDMGEFDISIAMSNININFQTNDNICGATNVGSGTLASGGVLSLSNQNNICATQEIGEPNTSQGAVQNEPEYDETMWYKFTTGPNPGAVEVEVTSLVGIGGFFTVPSLAVYKYVPSGNNCSTTPFANLASLDDDIGFATLLGGITDFTAKVTLPCVSPNTTYYVQVDGADVSLFGFTFPGFTDNYYYDIDVRDLGSGTGRAPNDNLANAIPVDNIIPIDGMLPAGGTLTIGGHNRCATCENGEEGDYCGIDQTDHTAAFGAEDETVWYYFTTPSNPGTISITVADDPGVGGTFSPNFALYYNNGAAPNYRVTAAPSSSIIKEGSSNTATIPVSSVSGNYTCLLPDTKYYIQIDGNDVVPFTDDQNDFIVTVTDDNSGNPGPNVPTNYDLICSANVLTIPANGTTGSLTRTNKCAWEEAGEPNTSDNIGGSGDDVTSNNYDETVWFSFVPPVDGDMTMLLEPTGGINGGVNYVLYQAPGTAAISCSGDIPTWTQLTEIASGTGLALNTIGTTDQIVETWPCLRANKRYYIQVDGNDLIGSNDVGNFTIQLTHVSKTTPVNDNICGIGITSATGNLGTFTTSATATAAAQDNRCATQEIGEPAVNGPYDDITDPGYDHTLWYKFVASTTDGTYSISITNAGGDVINGYIGLYRQDATVCSGVTPSFGNLTLVHETPLVNGATNNETMSLECWEIEEGKTYYFQVQGFDGLLGSDVGDNFNVSVVFTSGSNNPADNICTAPAAAIGTTYTADNRCATTQSGEPNISPSPQDPSDGADYDETLWYQFVAPASGEVRLNTSAYSPGTLTLSADLYSVPTGYNCGVSGFNGLVREDNTNTLTTLSTAWDLRCLVPGKTYYMRFDGNDGVLGIPPDKGTWNFSINNLDAATSYPSVLNDEPCGAVDVTQHVRTAAQGPCTSDGQYYTANYSILDAATDIDRATRSVTALGCNGELNCNDYWFKFTVPLDATGIRIQGNDEYPVGSLFNNSHEHIGIYRSIGGGCGGTLQRINCDDGGLGGDVDLSLAAFPGETLFVQVFNENAPASPANSAFGFCISVDCPAKTACTANNLVYNQSQCWNMNTNGANLSPQYYDCLPGSNNSVNYLSFSTDCDGTPVDTVTVVFSVTTIGCGTTAMSMFRDETPCVAPTGQYDDILINCAVFEEVMGGTTSTNFNSTFILPACATYIMQIISDENTSGCASSGQVVIVKSTLNPTQILPVELTMFTGYNNGSENILNWTTASELNSLKFEVEKSTDAINFEYIGERPAAGNSNSPRNYTLDDLYPVLGNNYYRLKMIDIDGQFKYSEIVVIKVNELNQVSDGIVSVYPNPTNDKVNIVYQSTEQQKLNLLLFNAIGQNMYSNNYAVNSGLNTITIDASAFAKGMYIIGLQNTSKGNNYQAKFVKE
ncbi:MAG: T9SS type A sorting domain-containing protein [Sphingobacteriales bacterium]|nr:T9SS type A sorting domain-containing protein [Sphingobacteriales bacterium]